jgi:Transcriptional repressor TCF25
MYCHTGRLHPTSLAACRLLLSLDPLRDPLNVLLSLDYHAIAVGRDYGYKSQIYLLRWLVDLVDLDLIHIWYRDKDEGSSTSYRCSLLDLPNWAYSHALALFDLHNAIKNGGNDIEVMDTFEIIKCKADSAIQRAISRYPAVVGCLLHNLDGDTTGRSFHRDWLPVLEKISLRERALVSSWHSTSQASLILSATLQTCDLITKIYVQQSTRLYADDSVVQWVYDNLVDLLSKEQLLPDPPNPAILRYASVDPTDYDVKFQMIPPDVNAIDVGLLAHALLVNPNRPRYLRRPLRTDDDQLNEVEVHEGLFGNRTHHLRSSFFGPPTEMVDPDWPMLEVFWRSLLPWNFVEGMPPPR